MFDENMVAQIHRHTNRGMRILKKREFTFAEIYAALGIIIRASADKDNLPAVDDLYLPNDRLHEKFAKKTDKMAAVREIWNMFQNNLMKHYVPSECLIIYEQVYGFCGNKPWRTV
ncbi:hypothetical protein T10_7646 [Trichinella papuae]|uniref:PiggyBac transposable element-derived protein domain-containing protein n=1 Tax=Trichinella papuae TaxID=268474 RepID=A0A0V1MLL3_9BILA|nr:hypothetical protein T10_7646 [Trichinella papuae]